MSVILYRYDTSPFSVKTDHALLLKNIPHEKVNVANMPPRPEITELLGVTYRRIPILAIGNDIYCDTSLIVSTLERRFPTAQGYGTLFPNRKNGGTADTGLIKMFVKYWADSALFFSAVPLVPFENLPEDFVKDRVSLGINVEAMVAGRGKAQSMLSTHLSHIEEQLSDGREWLFDTEHPSLADISVHFVCAWIKSRRLLGVDSLLDPNTFPKALEWLARMTNYLETLKQSWPEVPTISGSDAAARIVASAFEPYSVVGFDTREAERLGLKLHDEVSVARDDSANFGTVGKLIALNREEFVVERKGTAGLVRCHFPRIQFTAQLVTDSK
ncbi:hypothetical protein DFH07DRAFT_834450 [Mycena maculata]|uniref:GST N-terminal domain-containing protein n=1 Tax=Mycena maculata TaxID=230809 RepID=A0AAD7IJB4_9AGAR|nr:hypothetical protein DFH07DRAFT_834450 [Mycena maculata]